ncbi:hypothetical protein THAOC_20261, partial [Thalassiosira oceanica]
GYVEVLGPKSAQINYAMPTARNPRRNGEILHFGNKALYRACGRYGTFAIYFCTISSFLHVNYVSSTVWLAGQARSEGEGGTYLRQAKLKRAGRGDRLNRMGPGRGIPPLLNWARSARRPAGDRGETRTHGTAHRKRSRGDEKEADEAATR